MNAIRLQIAVGNRLVGDVIGSLDAMQALVGRWSRMRVASGQSAGSTALALASLPRLWDVPVGGIIGHQCEEHCTLCYPCHLAGREICSRACVHAEREH